MCDLLKEKEEKFPAQLANAAKSLAACEANISALIEQLKGESIGTDDELSEDDEKQVRKEKKEEKELDLTAAMYTELFDDSELVLTADIPYQAPTAQSEAGDDEDAKKVKKEKRERRINLKKLREAKQKRRLINERTEILKTSHKWDQHTKEIFDKIPPSGPVYSDFVYKEKDKPKRGSDSLPKAPKYLTIAQLQHRLEERDLSTEGKKTELVQRLQEAITKEDEELKQEIKSSFKDELNQDLAQRHGTKLATAIQYVSRLVAKDETAKILIFSQYQSFLHKFGELLDENSLKHVFIEGTALAREKSITAFKTGTVQILMISLENAASGTNLIEATHVILLDPVQGTKKESKAIEDQAVGRAHRQGQKQQVTVVRFIVTDTIEHEQYLLPNETGSPEKKKRLTRTSSLATFTANLTAEEITQASDAVSNCD